MSGEAFVNRTAFAALQGWSPSYVTKLGKQGRLVLDAAGKLVNVAETIAMLQRTIDPGKEAVRQHHVDQRVQRHVKAPLALDAPDDAEIPAAAKSSGADPKYWGNKARREGAMAELAELELAKARGELVERRLVESAAFGAARTLRDSLLGLPVQLAPQFAACSDAFEIETRLRDALRKLLTDASKMTAEDLQRITDAPH